MRVDFKPYFPYIVFFLAIIIYFPTLKYDYAWDDALVIKNNELTKKGFSGILEIWTSSRYIEDRPTYRPVPQTTFALEWALAPNNPRLAHFTNLILYGLCCLVLFSLLKNIFSEYSPYLILFISLLFVLHPMHTEVVANIKSRDEILAATFAFLTINSAYTFDGKVKHWKKWLPIVFFILLGLLSKISFITILPIVFWFPIQKNRSFLLSFFAKVWSDFKIYALPKLPLLLAVIAISISLLKFFPSNQTFYFLIGLLLFLFLRSENKWFDSFKYLLISIFFIQLEIPSLFVFYSIFYFYKIISKNTSLKNLLVNISIFTVISSYLFYLDTNSNFVHLFIVLSFPALFYLVQKNKKVFGVFSVIIVLIFIVLSIFVDLKLKHYLFPLLFVLLALKELNILNFKKIRFNFIVSFLLLLFFFLNQEFNFKNPIVENNTEIPTENNLTPNRLIENNPLYNILTTTETKSQKLASIVRIQGVYIKKLIYPYPLVHQHGVWQIELASFKDFDVWLFIFLHLFFIIFVIKRIQKKCPIALGILFYLITISIYTNIFYLMPDTLAERFLFVPSVGFLVALTFSIYKLLNLYLKKNTLAFTGVLLLPIFIFYTQKTWTRSKDWKDNFTLSANTLTYAQNNAVINAQYAAELRKKLFKNEIEKSEQIISLIEKHFTKAINIYSDFYSAQSDLGVFYIELQEPEKAFKHLKKASELNESIWINHYYLGLIYFDRKEYYKAKNSLKLAINYKDENVTSEERNNAYEYLGKSLFQLKNLKEMKQYLFENYELYGEKNSLILAGNLLAQRGEIKDALEVFYRLKKEYPEDDAIQPTIDYLLQFE